MEGPAEPRFYLEGTDVIPAPRIPKTPIFLPTKVFWWAGAALAFWMLVWWVL
jgi:hypothetical protein